MKTARWNCCSQIKTRRPEWTASLVRWMARIYLKKKKLKKEKLGAAVRAAAEHFCWLDDAASLYCKTNRESVRARGEKKNKKEIKRAIGCHLLRGQGSCVGALFPLVYPELIPNPGQQPWTNMTISWYCSGLHEHVQMTLITQRRSGRHTGSSHTATTHGWLRYAWLKKKTKKKTTCSPEKV